MFRNTQFGKPLLRTIKSNFLQLEPRKAQMETEKVKCQHEAAWIA